MKKNSTQKGFTIIETLVAVTILMISIAGPLTIAYKSYSSAVIAHDQITASYLAQDALEYIKNIRDNSLLQGTGVSMLQNFNGCIQSNPCTVDTLTGSIGPANNAKLYKSSEIGGYGHSGNIPTQFSRSFYLSNVVNAGSPIMPVEAKLTVEVAWTNGTIANRVLYENEIFNALK